MDSKKIKEDKSSLEKEDFDLSHFSDEEEGIVVGWFKKLGIFIFEIVKVVLISLAIILPVRLFLVQPFYVEGASMQPNFYQNEYLIVDEISYRFNEPIRGEIVIFKNPRDTRSYFIKRIIGLPGETITITNGKVSINDKLLAEIYIETFSADTHQAIVLGESEYFLMGDNRTNSLDSRQLGPINRDYFIGRVWLRGWPIDRMNTFNAPVYDNISQ